MLRVLEDSTSKRAVTVQSRENNRRYSGQSRGPGEGADSAMKSLTGVNYAQMLDGERRETRGAAARRAGALAACRGARACPSGPWGAQTALRQTRGVGTFLRLGFTMGTRLQAQPGRRGTRWGPGVASALYMRSAHESGLSGTSSGFRLSGTEHGPAPGHVCSSHKPTEVGGCCSDGRDEETEAR